MIVQLVTYVSRLSDDEALRTIEERAPLYRDLPGLVQKLYVHEPSRGSYGGIYLWEDKAAMDGFRNSELARSIADAYTVEGVPRVETYDVVSVLRRRQDATLQRAPVVRI